MDVDFTYTRPQAHNQVGRRRGRDFETDAVGGPSYGVGIHVTSSSSQLDQMALVDQVDGPVQSRASTSSKGSNEKIPTMSAENFPSLGGGERLAVGASASAGKCTTGVQSMV